MGDIAKQFTKNKLGITIVKCCASCKHHVSEGEEKVRKCKLTGCKHTLDYLCSKNWELDPSLENAGRGGGRVKKKSYLDYLMKEGSHHAEDYERQYGSKYLTKK